MNSCRAKQPPRPGGDPASRPEIALTLFEWARMALCLFALLPIGSASAFHPGDDEPPPAKKPSETGHRCLMVSVENIVKGKGNWFLYLEISTASHTFQKGDRIEYDILLPESNPVLKGGVDADVQGSNLPSAMSGKPWIRDCGLKDQNGILQHGDGVLAPAKQRWYHRRIDVSPIAGAVTARWNVVFEGDQTGRYVQFLDHIRVTREGKTVLAIYDDGVTPLSNLRQLDGYSRKVLIAEVERKDAMNAAAVEAALDKARQAEKVRTARAEFRAEMEIARTLAERLHDDRLRDEIDAAAKSEDAAAFDSNDAEAYMASLHRARHALSHAHPLMQQFTGHLVGHAHIDLQWLWTWDECVNEVIPQTFGQAVKFMDEFPGFTFSQSSPCLYVATEEHYPDLFKQIQEKVAKGQWEIVGGRWCEGDTNMISPESHVRHFLYGQRYFQNKFGRMATVGWEPDTFGHCWTMPQVLKKSGIDYYYFCRAGRGEPLFWWEGPDGSKVMAFEEPATGGWYNDGLDDGKVSELAKFVRKIDGFDHLMVYGVGNHGGGPTRENILAALAMKDRELMPNIKFSTAGEFFHRLGEQAEHLKIPTIKTELNPVFEGCYTSHSKIKKYNRDCESLLESAEVFAALGRVLGGPAYPRESFESMWRDVLWNHHHDTLPGSFIHASAMYSARMHEAVLERGHGILDKSLKGLPQYAVGSHSSADNSDRLLRVFNPLAWERSEVVEADLSEPVDADWAVTEWDGTPVPTQHISRSIDGDEASVRICFRAANVPGCGYKAFRLHSTPRDSASQPIKQSVNAPKAPPDGLQSARLQMLHEKAHGMSAWAVGEIDETEELDKPVSVEVLDDGPVRRRVRSFYRQNRSAIMQDRITYPGSDRVDFDTTVDWGEVGTDAEGSRMLKVAFQTGLKSDTATFEIPFGDITRKTDGHEDAALKWCDLTSDSRDGKSRGLAVLNDCKHGYDVRDGTIRLTLLRSSYNPDPVPDVGTHHMRYAALPHDGPLDRAAVVRAAWEFNKPMTVQLAAGRPSNSSDASWSGLSAEPASVIVTAVKLAEDSDDLIIRAYECAGREAQARLAIGFDAKSVAENDLIERPMPGAGRVRLSGRVIDAEFKPYEIRTFRIKYK